MFLASERCVCAVDFPHEEQFSLSWFPRYPKIAKFRLPIAARILQRFIGEMHRLKILKSIEGIILVGFSLGAHIAAILARLIQIYLRAMIALLFGKFLTYFSEDCIINFSIVLDPAKPYLANSPNRVRITDAKHIQSFHSSKLSFSADEVEAHVKIVINDGVRQPGCEQFGCLSSMFCSHQFSSELFYKISIKSKVYVAYRDPDANETQNKKPKWIVPGIYGKNFNITGTFYVNTDGTFEKKQPPSALKNIKLHKYRLL